MTSPLTIEACEREHRFVDGALELIERRLARQRAETRLADFITYASRGAWQPAPHLTLLCEALECVTWGTCKRLMVFMPPARGKSHVVSRHWPVWHLGQRPEHEIILTSYGAALAQDMSRYARRTFAETAEELWGLNLADDSAAVMRWNLANRNGHLIAAGVDGPLSGRHADVVIIDDPHKNRSEARSMAHQLATWHWYKEVLQHRIKAGGAVVLVMTRYDEGDLAGRLLEEARRTGEQWNVLSLPEMAEEADLLGREPGEALWPAMFSQQAMEVERGSIPGYVWDAMYQQHPRRAVEGALWTEEMLDGLRRRAAPELQRIVVAVDPAVTSNAASDETGIVVVGKDSEGHGYVLADLTCKKTPGLWARRVVDAVTEFNADCIVGEVNNGGDLVEANIRTVDRTARFKSVRASRGKVARAEPVASLYEQGRVHHVGRFPQLEGQLMDFTPDGYRGEGSPDRADAAVWGLTELLVRPSAAAGVVHL